MSFSWVCDYNAGEPLVRGWLGSTRNHPQPEPEAEILPIVSDWCERGDSNPHGFTRQILSLVRLPIPPLSRLCFQLYTAPCFCRVVAVVEIVGILPALVENAALTASA